MAKREEKFTEDEINAILDEEKRTSIGIYDQQLAIDQGEALDRYLGAAYGTEVDGRSHYISRDVMDTVEWIMPVLMDIYYSTDTPVNIEPQNESDVEGAAQETAYCSYVMNRKNDGFSLIHDFAKDGLIQKLGVVKHWWDESKEAREELYEGLTTEQMSALLSDPDVTVVQHTAKLEGKETSDFSEDPSALHDVRVTIQNSEGQVRLENVPPEEFRVSRKGTNKRNCPYMSHITTKTVSDIIDMGFDRDTIEGIAYDHKTDRGTTERAGSPQFVARYRADSTDPSEFISSRQDLSMIELDLEEHYIRIDENDDGIAEIRQIFRIDRVILSDDEIGDFPFTWWSPIKMPHKLIGLSVTDLVEDLQRIKTHLIRAMIDTTNNASNGSYLVLNGMANIEDIMTQGPLRIIRQKVPGAVTRMNEPGLPQEAFQLLSYIDSVKEGRTGVSQLQQGLDNSVLGSNTAAMAVTQMLSAAQQRIQLIARVMAETGLREMYRSIHKLVLEHVESEEIFRLNEKFVAVNPAEWHSRKDFTVSVGTGHANKDQKMLHLQMLSQDLAQMIASGEGKSILTEKNIYNFEKEKFLAAGFKNYSLFLTDPDTQQQKGPDPAQQLQQQMAMQQMQLNEREMRVKEAEAQIKEAEVIIKKAEADVAAEQARAQIDKIHYDAALSAFKLKLDQEEYQLEKTQKRPVKLG